MSTPMPELSVRLQWRMGQLYNPTGAYAELYAHDVYLGEIVQFFRPPRPVAPWRAWVMDSHTGREVGWYETEQEARDALLTAALRALGA